MHSRQFGRPAKRGIRKVGVFPEARILIQSKVPNRPICTIRREASAKHLLQNRVDQLGLMKRSEPDSRLPREPIQGSRRVAVL